MATNPFDPTVVEEAPKMMGNAMVDDSIVQGFDKSIQQDLENHLDSLPDEAKTFILKNLTDETVTILGLVLGPEALDFFAKTRAVRDKGLPMEGRAQAVQAGMPSPSQGQSGAVGPAPAQTVSSISKMQ